MGLLEPITHSEEIEKLLSDAKRIYEDAEKRMDRQKSKTSKSLEELGKTKVASWSTNMDGFVHTFQSFTNIEMQGSMVLETDFYGKSIEPAEMMVEIKQASMTAGEIAKMGFTAAGTGALIGVATYGGAMMFGTASTGTAIAALSGAAKTNATLAFLGGGAKAAGGLGMVGGKIMLAGAAVIPFAVVAGLIAGARGKQKLAEAKEVHAQAEQAAVQMKTVTTGMEGIEKMTRNYNAFIVKLGKKFRPFLREMERIRSEHPCADGQQIDYNELSEVEQKTLHLTWLLAQVYYHVLTVPLLTADGKVTEDAESVLASSVKELKQFQKDTFKMCGADAQAADLFWKSQANIVCGVNFVYIALLLASIFLLPGKLVTILARILSGTIAFPIFFKFRNLPESKKYIWRLVRLATAIVFLVLSMSLV